MAWIPDDSLQVMINLMAEGFLSIESHTFPSTAHAGDIIQGTIRFKNIGATADNFSVSVTVNNGSQTITILEGIYSNLAVGIPFDAQCLAFTMPAEQANITIETFHEQ